MSSSYEPIWYARCEHMRVPRDSVGETSNMIQAFGDIFYGAKLTINCYQNTVANTDRSIAGELWKETLHHSHISTFEIAVLAGMTIAWTILRHFMVHWIFVPFATWVGVLPKNIEKFGESAWKFIAYGINWSTAFYVTFYCGYDFFTNTLEMWASTGQRPFDLSMSYALETSFYLHSVYATLYMDAWRKDSMVMLTHHFVTLWLVVCSYIVGSLKIGVLIFLLDDISDVVLESGKVATYMRHRTTGYSAFFGILCDVASCAFAGQWAVLRLFYHITKVWRSATLGVWVSQPVLPFPIHIFFVAFLGSLYIFYTYWFAYIVMFLIRVLSGKQGSAEDPREDDNDNKQKSEGQQHHKKKLNGAGKPIKKEE